MSRDTQKTLEEKIEVLTKVIETAEFTESDSSNCIQITLASILLTQYNILLELRVLNDEFEWQYQEDIRRRRDGN